MIKPWLQQIHLLFSPVFNWFKGDRNSSNTQKLITINFGAGTLNTGFPSVTIQIFDSSNSLIKQEELSLSDASNLDSLLQNWRVVYFSVYGFYYNRSAIEIDTSIPTNISILDLNDLGIQLHNALNQWLLPLERKLLYLWQQIPFSRVIITTDNQELQKIPWHLWAFFYNQEAIEFALSASNYARQTKSATPEGRVRILAVFGNSDGLNLDFDEQVLQSLPDCELHILKTPQRRELDEKLRDSLGWDILFFAGHSSSENKMGILKINDSSFA